MLQYLDLWMLMFAFFFVWWIAGKYLWICGCWYLSCEFGIHSPSGVLFCPVLLEDSILSCTSGRFYLFPVLFRNSVVLPMLLWIPSHGGTIPRKILFLMFSVVEGISVVVLLLCGSLLWYSRLKYRSTYSSGRYFWVSIHLSKIPSHGVLYYVRYHFSDSFLWFSVVLFSWVVSILFRWRCDIPDIGV